ncbi:MAG: helix-turn-helix transcriptional regulator [Eubacteriales bacterium]|nr:helix-turn-helix transcriptional regulator [Eubacteriales bacterium]
MLRRYILSFLCVGLIPVIALGLTLCISQYTSRKAALHEELYGKVENISAYYETLINKVETIAAHYTSNYYSADDAEAADQQLQLLTYRKSHALQGSLFLYDRGLPYMHTEELRMDYDEFEKKYPFGCELNAISFYELINSLTTSRYISTLDYNGQSNFYACIVPIPYLDAAPTQTLLYFESIDTMRDSIINYLGDFSGYFCIQDSELRVSYMLDSYGRMQPEETKYAIWALTGTPIVHHTMDGVPFVSFRVPSARLGFTYVLSIPEHLLYADLTRTVALYAAAMSALFAVVLVLTIMLSRRLLEPIHSLEKELNIDDEDEEDRKQQDVFEAIRRHYQTVRETNDRLVMQLQSNTRDVRTKLMSDLLLGRITGERQLTNALRASSVQFEHNHFYIIVFLLHAANPLDDPAGSAAEYLQEVRFSAGQAYGAETGDPCRFCVIINRRALTPEESEDETRLGMARLFQTQLQDFGFQVLCAGVSACHHSPLRLNQCLIEAYTAIAEGDSAVRLYHVPEHDPGVQSFEDSEMLRQCLLVGDAEVAVKTLDRLTEGMRAESLPVSLRQARFFQIANTISSAAAKAEHPIDSVALSILAAEADQDRFLHAAQEHIRDLCSDMETQRERKREDFSNSVIAYLYEHFTDNLLTAESVAEHFGISESMVRRMVKEATGTSFANYVTTLRFAHVKRRLAETNMQIKDIVEEAGYMDVSSFTRKFKASEGVTPGQYRAMLRQDAVPADDL